MKYTLEEIRAEAYDTRLMDYDNTADMLEAMLKAVEALKTIEPALKRFAEHHSRNRNPAGILMYAPQSNFREEPSISLRDVLDLVAALAPFDFTTEEEVKP